MQAEQTTLDRWTASVPRRRGTYVAEGKYNIFAKIWRKPMEFLEGEDLVVTSSLLFRVHSNSGV